MNFTGGTAGSVLAPTDEAGVAPFAQTNWNNFNPEAPAPLLFDSAGNPTSLTLSGVAIIGGVLASPAGGDEILNDGFAASATPGSSITFTLSSIPYASYILVVYDLAGSGEVQAVTVGGTTFFTTSPNPTAPGFIDGNPNTPFIYIQGVGMTLPTSTPNADYAVFAGNSSTLSFTVAPVLNPVAQVEGFQIIDTVAVPEPGTINLLVGAATGFLLIRRRRR